MTGPSKKAQEALHKCDKILEALREPYVIFVFEEQGCSISNGFCCPHHMKENIVGMLTAMKTETEH